MMHASLRFWTKVDKSGPGGCWLWKAGTNPKGYGRFLYQGRNWLAHRLAWLFGVGEIPPGKDVLHRCDNPTCVNYVRHLYLGDKAANMRDLALRGRSPWAKVTPDQRRDMAARFAAGTASQRELAAEYGISQPRVNRIVNNPLWLEAA